ncbi:MAG: MEKHLA domain-containing protein [Cyanobacteria bacterium P01_F01_bin.150]
MCQSFQQVVGRAFPKSWTPQSSEASDMADVAFAKDLFYAPFVVVSHNTDADPVFNYGNQAALSLFELNWDEFTTLPSRQSAEPPNREERSHLLHAVTTQGYIQGYQGIRISKTGKRFRIEDVTVWNMLDDQGNYHGQAAIYSKWTYL